MVGRLSSIILGAGLLGAGTLAWGQADPSAACAALARVALRDTVIEGAQLIAAGAQSAASQPIVGHCLVRGMIEPRTGRGVGGASRGFGTGFELRLPLAWNGRFYFQGGGGTDGVIRPAHGLASSTPGLVPALNQGYAVVSTDAGHQGADASFGLDPQARIDWAYRSVDLTARVAKALIAAHYGRAPARSYFVGCSNGGRQGMMAAQRSPSLFDGIVAGNPGYRLPMSSASGTVRQREFLKLSPAGADGKPDLTRAFTPAELGIVGRAVLAACDAADGAADGLVENWKACRFDLSSVQCRAGQSGDCLPADKVQALRVHFEPTRTATGKTVYPGFPFDPSVAEPGWSLWTLGQSSVARANAGKPGPGQHLFVTPPDETATAERFDLDRDIGNFALSDALMSADNTDLSGFRLRGGKLILYHGLADPVFSALDTVRYYEGVAQELGSLEETATFARLFLIPGMNHCSGGKALDSFDALTPLVDWVEKGIAPAGIAARGQAFPGRIRDLCPYPRVARYRGTGSVDDAASFTCSLP